MEGGLGREHGEGWRGAGESENFRLRLPIKRRADASRPMRHCSRYLTDVLAARGESPLLGLHEHV